MLVLDCSAAVPIALRTEEGMALKGLFLSGERVVSSKLLYPELCSAMRKYVRTGVMQKDEAAKRIDAALGMVDEFYGFEDVYVEAFNESLRLNHKPYDLFYFVLARRLGATLFTEDRHLVELCEQNGVDCIHIVDLVKED